MPLHMAVMRLEEGGQCDAICFMCTNGLDCLRQISEYHRHTGDDTTDFIYRALLHTFYSASSEVSAARKLARSSALNMSI